MSPDKVFIVEDDRTLLDLLKYNLKREGYLVSSSADGAKALELIRLEKPDVVLTDVMLPGMDGLELCRALRRESNVPVLMLTARSEEVDKVVGLELGADDYMTKPFSMRELLVRIKAMLRRADMQRHTPPPPENRPILKAGNIELDGGRHHLTVNGHPVELTPKEFDLLHFLMVNKGHVFTRERLLDGVWGHDFPGEARTVDVHIRWLRQKLEADSASPRHLFTVRGVGYKFES